MEILRAGELVGAGVLGTMAWSALERGSNTGWAFAIFAAILVCLAAIPSKQNSIQ